jgi:hypothetical protein
VDKDESLIKLWKWLQKCSKDDLYKLPVLNKGEKLSDFDLSPNELLFMSRLVNIGVASPRETATKWASNEMARRIVRTADILHKIKNWTIIHGDYRQLNNQKVTWFIDPPYPNGGGNRYTESSDGIDYHFLKGWCESREGQVIVCGNSFDDWMGFTHKIRDIMGSERSYSTEVMWTNSYERAKVKPATRTRRVR